MRIPPDIPLSKYGRREVSVFVANELLYDRFSERLDPERQRAVDEQIEKHSSLKQEMSRIRSASVYASQLSKLTVPSLAFEKIDEPDTYMSVLLKKTNFERWPLAVRWGTEAALVLCFFMVVLVAMPWNSLLNLALSPQGREVILAEVQRKPRPDFENADVSPVVEDNSGFEDEGVKVPAKPDTVAVNPPLPPSVPTEAAPAAKPSAAGTPSSAPSQGPAPSASSPAARPSPPEKTDVAQAASDSSKKPGEGALFRGTLRVTNLTATSPKIVEKIEELGGRKAGQVELGWKKTATSSYFHFTMPEAKYDDLMTFLGEYGNARIQKEKHPRVMPEGIVRLIIEVEEAEK